MYLETHVLVVGGGGDGGGVATAIADIRVVYLQHSLLNYPASLPASHNVHSVLLLQLGGLRGCRCYLIRRYLW